MSPAGSAKVVTTGMDDNYLSVMLNKVPQMTLAFWVIKVMSTTVGEIRRNAT
jgi:uncharacterized membrane-anchored protein